MNKLKLFLTILLISLSQLIIANGTPESEIDRDIWNQYILSYDNNDGPMHVSFHHKEFVRIIPHLKKIQGAESYFPHVLEWMSGAKSKNMKVSIDFRFLQRIIKDKLAFETVVYKYQQENSKGKMTEEYGIFKVTHKKVDGHWKLAQDLTEGSVEKEVWDSAPLLLTGQSN